MFKKISVFFLALAMCFTMTISVGAVDPDKVIEVPVNTLTRGTINFGSGSLTNGYTTTYLNANDANGEFYAPANSTVTFKITLKTSETNIDMGYKSGGSYYEKSWTKVSSGSNYVYTCSWTFSNGTYFQPFLSNNTVGTISIVSGSLSY